MTHINPTIHKAFQLADERYIEGEHTPKPTFQQPIAVGLASRSAPVFLDGCPLDTSLFQISVAYAALSDYAGGVDSLVHSWTVFLVAVEYFQEES